MKHYGNSDDLACWFFNIGNQRLFLIDLLREKIILTICKGVNSLFWQFDIQNTCIHRFSFKIIK